MRSLVLEICRSRSQSLLRSCRRGARIACGFAVLTASVLSHAGESTPGAQVDLQSITESQRLRIESRIAAEQGDFVKAAGSLQAAARIVGDRTTADRAGQAKSELEAGGGNQFANFGPLIQLIQDQTSPPAKWFTIDSEGGRMSEFAQGVFLGAPAMLASITLSADNSGLQHAASMARTSNQNQDVRVSSELRLVSLSRLERHVQQLIESGKEVPADVLCLAGMTEVRFLFMFPESNDVVIGGPAGDWKVAQDGRSVGVEANRPTLQLDDLVTLSRTFSPNGSRFFMCSIDPKQGQVKALNDFVAANRNSLNAKNASQWAQKLEDTLGLQNVLVQGVPANSRVASVIVDADYRMKEIGIGERDGVSGMKSYFDLLSRTERRGQKSMDALRWWLTVGYDSIRVSPDQQSFALTGRSVQCLSENQLVKADGLRESTGQADRANAEFAKLFTENLPKLAEQDLVFADLQNIFDLALVSAMVHSNGLAARTGWTPSTFAPEGEFAADSVEVPRELMTAAQSRVYSGGDVVIQVAGGVRGDLLSIARDAKNFVADAELVKDAAKAHPAGQSGNRWWWDAATR